MMNLIIDVGNTYVKTAVFESNKVLAEYKFNKEFFLIKIEKIFDLHPNITHSIISSVVKISKNSVKALSVFCQVHFLDNKSKVPFKNLYTTPETLGVDRIALITAAFYDYNHKNVLIIDAGTCITYDFIDKVGTYYGGAISPGIKMRFKALNTFTANLPLIELSNEINQIGNSTKTAITSGVVNGTINEIEGTIDQYSQKYEGLTIILTGGDSDFLSKRLKSSIFANSIFLLKGLNYILELNKC